MYTNYPICFMTCHTHNYLYHIFMPPSNKPQMVKHTLLNCSNVAYDRPVPRRLGPIIIYCHYGVTSNCAAPSSSLVALLQNVQNYCLPNGEENVDDKNEIEIQDLGRSMS